MILITGGAGFIGSHLSQRLVEQGRDVLVFDNFNDFYDPRIKRKNVQAVNAPGDGGRQFVVAGDIRDRNALDALFSEHAIESVVHLAAMAGVRPSIQDPTLYTDVNINGTLNLLEASREHGIGQIVFASSSSVYGNNQKVPFSEDDPVDHPISPYAATKKAGELLAHTYHALYDINVACLRFFTVYGPRQRPDLAIHKFARRMDAGEPIPFYGDGSTQRDYTYIDDIIDGVVKAMDWLQSTEKRYDIFNLGESQTISLQQMLDTLQRALGQEAMLDRQPMQPGDVVRTNADIEKAKRVLGYDPQTSFEDGIAQFVQWFKQNKNKTTDPTQSNVGG